MFIVSDKPDRMLYTSAFLIYRRGDLFPESFQSPKKTRLFCEGYSIVVR